MGRGGEAYYFEYLSTQRVRIRVVRIRVLIRVLSGYEFGYWARAQRVRIRVLGGCSAGTIIDEYEFGYLSGYYYRRVRTRVLERGGGGGLARRSHGS